MPRYSPVTFAVQQVEDDGKNLGHVVSGFLTRNQSDTLRELVDSSDYERSKRWRGEYLEMARAIINAIDEQRRAV